MPDLKCRDGDLNGYGCISSQFVDSLTFTSGSPAAPDQQWFNKIARFRYELELTNGTRVTEQQIRDAIVQGQITSCTLVSVTYTPDPNDAKIAYAEGALEIIAVAGSPISTGTYKFRHTLALVWRLTETKFSS
jgi:hypothetical protein